MNFHHPMFILPFPMMYTLEMLQRKSRHDIIYNDNPAELTATKDRSLSNTRDALHLNLDIIK